MTASEYEYALFDCVTAYCVLSTEYQYLKKSARLRRATQEEYVVYWYGSDGSAAVYGSEGYPGRGIDTREVLEYLALEYR